MPPLDSTVLPHDAEGLFRFSGMYGEVYRDGVKRGEVSECSGAVDIGRIDVPVPGSDKTAYKDGRKTREGTIRFQKIDSSWEYEVWQRVGRTLQQRRADRDAGVFNLGFFDLQLRLDDPDALGVEAIALYNVKVWRMPIGFSQGDELIERELPITWEAEQPISMFTADLSGNVPKAIAYPDLGPK